MIPVPEIIRIRSRRSVSTQRKPLVRAALIISILFSLALVIGGTAFMLVYASLTRDLPSLQTLPDLLHPQRGLLLHPTRLYDRSGEHILLTLENPAAQEREFLSLDQEQENFLPTSLISATLTTTDPGFWHHPGYLIQGINGNKTKTLAQRLASDLLLWQEKPGLRRDWRELLLAAQITADFGKEQVLIWYLNSTDYGRLAHGADAASRVYFGKPASKLSLREAAALAAAAQSPALNPLDAPLVAQEKSLEIIETMLTNGWIDESQADEARRQSLTFSPPVAPLDNPAPAFTSLVLEQISAQFDLTRLERGGIGIYTSLDYDLQIQANCAIQVQLARLEGLPETSNEACPAALLLPTLPPSDNLLQHDLNANLVVVNPQNGEILAMAGETTPGLDPAHLPGHTPGTLLTPFIYLTGFTRGLSPASLVWDIPNASASDLNPNVQYHGPMRLRIALANDYLTPAEQVLEQVGAENAWRTARQMGLVSTELPSGTSPQALVNLGEATLLEITRAYAVLANAGNLTGVRPGLQETIPADSTLHPSTYLRMTDSAGRLLLDQPTPMQKPVINPQLAYLVTHALSDEPARWASLGHPNPLEIGRPAAAKMGRTGQSKDAWAVGFTPYLSVGVWIGLRDPETNGIVNPTQAAGLWHAIMQYASRNSPPTGWEQPPGINTLMVCATSGLLPTPECPSAVNEVFIAGSEPTQTDTLYRKAADKPGDRFACHGIHPRRVDRRAHLLDVSARSGTMGPARRPAGAP